MTELFIHNISELVTLEPLAFQKKVVEIENKDLGTYHNAWLWIKDGKIFGYGDKETKPDFKICENIIDAKQKLILPGLIDSHTHPLYAGSRHDEFAMRLDGKTYQEIAQAGGGIKATVRATREASDETLLELARKRFKNFLSKGVTTIEAKSGYGLSPSEEIRELEILNYAAQETNQLVITTCLGLHALPPEFKDNKAFVKLLTDELLPEVASRKLAMYVDAFIENGYFTVSDCEPYFQKASDLGLKIRIHADEFSDAGAASAAAQWQASSADHLQFASDDGISLMAEKGVIATLLPGTSLYTTIPFTQARRFIQRGCGIALATDFNPGSCLVDNLAMMATIGALHCGLKAAEAIAAVTYVPAVSLGLGHHKGALAKGYDADFLIYDVESATEWLADMGRTKPSKVWIQGVQQI
ncbi:MAG: imidazolonepropionase [Bdellovibrionota bacterium]